MKNFNASGAHSFTSFWMSQTFTLLLNLDCQERRQTTWKFKFDWLVLVNFWNFLKTSSIIIRMFFYKIYKKVWGNFFWQWKIFFWIWLGNLRNKKICSWNVKIWVEWFFNIQGMLFKFFECLNLCFKKKIKNSALVLFCKFWNFWKIAFFYCWTIFNFLNHIWSIYLKPEKVWVFKFKWKLIFFILKITSFGFGQIFYENL